MKQFRAILLHRRVIMGALVGLAGVAVNVVVVLACSLTDGKNSPSQTYFNTDWPPDEVFVHRWFGGGSAHYWTRPRIHARLPVVPPIPGGGQANVKPMPDVPAGTYDDLPHWIDLWSLKHWNERQARGWPMLAMYCDVEPDGIYAGGWKITLPRWWSSNATKETRVIPYRPIWRGIIVNTLFYIALMWVGRTVYTRLRGARRRRKGLCFGCGYDLRGADHDVCPECGAVPEPQRAQTEQ